MEEVSRSFDSAKVWRRRVLDVIWNQFAGRVKYVDGTPASKDDFERVYEALNDYEVLEKLESGIANRQQQHENLCEITAPFNDMVAADARLVQYLHQDLLPRNPWIVDKVAMKGSIEDQAIEVIKLLDRKVLNRQRMTFWERLQTLFVG